MIRTNIRIGKYSNIRIFATPWFISGLFNACKKVISLDESPFECHWPSLHIYHQKSLIRAGKNKNSKHEKISKFFPFIFLKQFLKRHHSSNLIQIKFICQKFWIRFAKITFSSHFCCTSQNNWKTDDLDLPPIRELIIIPIFPPFKSHWKVQIYAKWKIIQSAKWCKVQNYTRCKIKQNAKLCKVQNNTRCKIMQSVELCRVQYYVKKN